MKQVRTEIPDNQRQTLYRQAIILALGGNLVLVIAKGVLAWLTGSSALFSDAANSFSDTLYSIFMGAGLYLSQRPADQSHPQGHSRFEPLVSLFIALAMTAAGITAIWQSIDRFRQGGVTIGLGWPTGVLLGSMLVKLGMYLWMRRLGERSKSPAIRASARDNLADILTSGAALVGVWGAHVINPLFDPAAGLLVGLWIFHATWDIGSENLGYLTGRGASEELIGRIAERVKSVAGVEDVHRIIAEYVGPQMRVDMHIDVMGSLTLDKAHEIAENVRTVVEELPEVDLAFIHVEPAERTRRSERKKAAE